MLVKYKCSGQEKKNACLACGKTEGMQNRRYCSISCRQKLRQKLNARSGLLQALNTRYATFYFSDTTVIMDVVPHGVKEIFRFTQVRSSGHSPGEDYSKMADMLGHAWWDVERKTNRKYLASRHVLEMASRHEVSLIAFHPRKISSPAVQKRYLEYLALDKAALNSRELRQVIKNAYRRQAKIHHPDIGGSAVRFRKIHEAYRGMLHWAENPDFIVRRGFVDKWFYDGDKKHWVQPMPNK